MLLPDGMDPDDLIRARGPGAMADAIDGRIALSELLWMRERDAEPLDTPERQAGLEARLMAAATQIKHPGVRAAYERDLKARMKDHFWQLRQAARGSANRNGDYRKRSGSGQFPASGEQGQVELKGGAPAKLRGLGAVVRAVDTPELLDLGAETLALSGFADPDVGLIRDALLDFAHAGNPIDRGAISAHLAEAGNMRAASLLKEYPHTPPIAVDGPEAREWLIALEQYMVAGRSAEQDPDAGMDDASADATSSPSAWRRKHQLVAERRALKARMNEAAGKIGES